MPEKKIGDRTYKVDKMPATQATRNLIRLGKIVGPAMPALASAIAGEGKSMDEVALPAIAGLLMDADPTDLTAFLVEIAETATVAIEKGSYEDVQYDLHCGDLLDALQLVSFVLQVNYRDFFGGKLGSILNKAKAAA